MAEASSYPVAIPTRTENTISVATLRAEQTNDATYSHALIHQQVGADVVALATYLGTNASQTAPIANTVLYSASNGVSIWSASPTLTTLTLSTDLIVDTNTFVVDGSDSRVYVGGTSSAATEIFQVFGSTRLQSTTPEIRLNETDAASDNKEWKFGVASEQLYGSVVNDAGNTTANWITVDRAGAVVNDIKLFNYGEEALQILESSVRALDNREIRSYSTSNTTYTSILHNATNALWFTGVGYHTIVGGLQGLVPETDNTHTLGKTGNRWSEVWAANGTIQTSDIRQKTVQDVELLGLDFVKEITPIAYKWKDAKRKIVNNGVATFEQKEEEDKRVHYGFSAQQVKEELLKTGRTTKDFAGIIVDEESGEHGLRDPELLPIVWKAVQELEARVRELES